MKCPHSTVVFQFSVQFSRDLEITCENIDELEQVYHLEVRDKSSGELVQNITSDSPRFLVTDLPPVNWLAGLNLTV